MLIRRLSALLWALLFVVPLAHAEQPAFPVISITAHETLPPFENWPKGMVDGYLMPDETGAPREFIHEDPDEGRWIYLSQNLSVVIERHHARVNRRALVWYEADIRCRDGQMFQTYSANMEKPGRNDGRPEQIAKKHKLVFAQNGDFFSWRIRERKYPGLIIRNGRLIHDKTYTKRVMGVAPLDELSFYPDGRMDVHYPAEVDAAGYQALGATDVLAFGPVLLRDGRMDDRLVKGYRSPEPRSALGMVDRGHFVGIYVEGRTKRSAGIGLQFVAERLAERGCLIGFNLDGGQTAAMLFMGKPVMIPGTYNGFTKIRSQCDIIGIGQSDGLPQ